MINNINTIIKDELLIALGTISGVTVLDGWITHYVHKFSEVGTNITFPAIALQPDSEVLKMDGNKTRATAVRSFRIIGAVSNKNPEIITEDLNNLLYDVRKALAFNLYDNKYVMQEIDFMTCNFNLPEKGEPYAFFDTLIEVKYQEAY